MYRASRWPLQPPPGLPRGPHSELPRGRGRGRAGVFPRLAQRMGTDTLLRPRVLGEALCDPCAPQRQVAGARATCLSWPPADVLFVQVAGHGCKPHMGQQERWGAGWTLVPGHCRPLLPHPLLPRTGVSAGPAPPGASLPSLIWSVHWGVAEPRSWASLDTPSPAMPVVTSLSPSLGV